MWVLLLPLRSLFALTITVDAFYVRLVSNRCPCLFFILSRFNGIFFFNQYIITPHPSPHSCCTLSRLCILALRISVPVFFSITISPSCVSLRHVYFFRYNHPSQSSLDITEARIKRLRERAGRKYTYVRILIRFVKKTIERRKKNKPTRFCVLSVSPAATTAFIPCILFPCRAIHWSDLRI